MVSFLQKMKSKLSMRNLTDGDREGECKAALAVPPPPPKGGFTNDDDDDEHFLCDLEVQVVHVEVSTDPNAVDGGVSLSKLVMEFESQGQAPKVGLKEGAPVPEKGGVLTFVDDVLEFKELTLDESKGVILSLNLKRGDQTVSVGERLLKDDLEDYLHETPAQLEHDLITTDPTTCPYTFTITYKVRIVNMVEVEELKPSTIGPANMVYVTICSAMDLTNGGQPESSLDSYVKLSCGSWSNKTSNKPSTRDPAWNERFVLLLDDTPLKVEVYDKFQYTSDQIGEELVGLSSLHDPKNLNQSVYMDLMLCPKGTATVEEEEHLDEEYLGVLRIKMVPMHGGEEPDLSGFNQGELDFDVGQDDSDEDMDDVDMEEEEEEEEELTPEEQAVEAARLESEKKKLEMEMKRIANIDIKEGSYTFHVHIIEVRDLASRDKESGNDPVVEINCFDQLQTTKILKDTNSAIFDDVFYFELKEQTRDDLEQGVIKINVLDADVLGKSLIGSFQADFDYIYYRDNHELYRQWVALSNTHVKSKGGVQGYLHLSVTILGPNDRIPFHDRKKEIKEERENAGIVEGELQMVDALMPQISQKLQFLVVTVYMGQNIPPLDMSFTGRKSIDAYVLVKFADSEPIRTRIVVAKDKGFEGGRVTVTWSQQIYIPIQVPTMTNRIEISVWDKDDLAKDEIVGTCGIFSFKAVQNKIYAEPFWAPIYGGNLLNKPFHNRDKLELQGTKPREATTSRGELLLTLRMDTNEGKKKRIQMVYKEMLTKRHVTPKMPRARKMILRCAVYSGSDLPAQKGLGSKKLSVMVAIARHDDMTDSREFSATAPGIIHWNKILSVPEVGGNPLLLPVDPKQIPDIFVYLVRGTGSHAEPIAFARFNAKDLLDKGFRTEPHWVHLTTDQAVTSKDPNEFAGSLLLRLGFGPEEQAPDWGLITMRPPKPVRLNVYIYQARYLCPSDDSGLLDPYVVVRFNGKGKKNKRVKSTRNPNWYDSLSFDTYLPDDSLRWPVITVKCMDHDSSILDKDDWVGTVRIPPEDIKNKFNMNQVMGRRLSKPKWYPLQHVTPGDTSGEILINFELITKNNEKDPAPSPLNIVPAKEKCVVEVIPVGLRDLRQKGVLGLNKPFVEIRVGDDTRNYVTDSSNRPSHSNPNFQMEKLSIETRLPIDPTLAPCLNVSAFDSHLGGLSKPLLGTTSIPLGTRYKNTRQYIKPGGSPYASNPFLEEKDSGVVPQSFKMSEQPTEEEEEEESTPSRRTSIFDAIRDIGDEIGGGIDGLGDFVTRDLLPGEAKEPDIDMDAALKPKYLTGKARYHSELEWQMQKTPFEEFPLNRGMKTSGMFSTPFQKVGYFKVMVRVVRKDSRGREVVDPFPCDIDLLKRPGAYQVRLYVLKAFRLRALDAHDNKADPYVKATLGNEVQSRRDQAISGEINNVPLLQYFEFKSNFPGNSKLKIEVFDRDLLGYAFGNDDLIGTTIIDLEDRWFSTEWQEIIWDRSQDPDKPALVTPVETRSLWMPTSSGPQGNLELWVDIIPSKDVGKYTPLDISAPPKSKFQLRLIVYKIKDWQLPGDSFTSMTDMFIRCKLGVNKHWQESDTHLRAQTRASFNWRFKFDMELPMNKEGSSQLNIQIWDFDLLRNDMLLEQIFDLSSFIQRGFVKNEIIQFFEPEVEEPSKLRNAVNTATAAAQRAQAAADRIGNTVDRIGGRVLCSPDRTDIRSSSTSPKPTSTVGYGTAQSVFNGAGTRDIETGGISPDTSPVDEKTGLLSAEAGGASGQTSRGLSTESTSREEGSGSISRGILGVKAGVRFRGSGSSTGSGAVGVGGGSSGVSAGTAGPMGSAGTMGGGGGSSMSMGQSTSAYEETQRKKKKKLTMWGQVKDGMGLGPDPLYSRWIPLQKTERAKNGSMRTVVVGQMLMGLELLPCEAAEARNAGFGREAPNSFPTLMQPEGRPDLTQMLNPLYLIKTCFGEGLLYKFLGVLCCMGTAAIFFFAGPSIFDVISISLQIPYGSWLLLGLLLCSCCLLMNTIRECRASCGCGEEDESDDEDEGYDV